MEVRVLGPLEVWRGDEAAALPGAKPRQLLALLAMRPNQRVWSEVLIDELWDQSPPSTAASALRTHVTSVRRVLSGADTSAEGLGSGPRLTLDAAGYALRLERDELDATRFEHLVEQGKDAVARGDLHHGEEALQSALSLWRGPALFDVRDLSAAKAVIARLEQARLAAIEELAEVRLILGDSAAAVDWLVEVVKEFPLHEGLAGQLMRALDRTGRTAEALREYTRVQRDLDEQLGMRPSAELRRLEEDILLQQTGLQFNNALPRRAPSRRSPAARRFVGRRAEIERLLALDDATGLVLVEGEAGVGKTALVDEYCRRVRGLDGITMLTGRCEDGEVDEYHAVKALMGDDFPQAADERHAVSDYEADHARLLDGIAMALAAMQQRVLLIVEDLHWAGGATLSVLRHVLRHPDLGHVRVVATLRSDETHGALADRIRTLCSRARTQRIALHGLDEFEVRALVRSVAAPDVAPTLTELARNICATTNGNPFHVRALLQELDDSGLQAESTARVHAEITDLAPAGVRQLLDRRLARLAPTAVHAVRTAAVVGSEVSLSTLGSLCGLVPGELADAVDQAIYAHILVEDDERVGVVTFEHALLRNSAYSSIPEPEREALHECVASEFRRADPECPTRRAADVAHHLLRAGPDIDAGLIQEYARRAGADAFEELAFDDAARWFERALEHCSPADAVGRPAAELYLAMGRAREADHEFARAHDAYVRGASLRDLDDAGLRADLVLAASGPWISLSDDPASRARLRTSLAEIGDRDPVRKFRLINSLAGSLYHVDPTAEAELAKEALAQARALGDDFSLARAHMSWHLSLTHEPPAYRERLATAETALRHARAGADRELELTVRRELLSDLLECGRRSEFDSELDDYEQAATAASMPRDMYRTMALRATQKILDGDLVTGEQFARGASLRGRSLGLEAAGAEFLQQFVVRYQQGRLAEMAPALAGAGPVMSQNRAGGALAAVAYAVTRQHDDARRMVRWVLGGGTLARDSFWLGAHAMLAAAAVAMADAELATPLFDALTPSAGQIIVFGSGGAVLGSGYHWLGQLALVRDDLEGAVDYLEAADSVAVEVRAPYWISCARRAQSVALTRLGRPGDRERAELLLADALRIADDQGFRAQ